MEPVSQPWRAIEPAPGPVVAPPSSPGRWVAIVLGALALLAALVVGGWILVSSAPQPMVSIDGAAQRPAALEAPGDLGSGAPSSAPSPTAAAQIVVDVEGAVLEPGLYRLPSGSRVGDAIAAAGGYSTEVDAAATSQGINLAEELADGAKIHVPARGGALPAAAGTSPGTPPLFGGAGGSSSATSLAGPRDLNHASQAELEELPGIGPVTAQKIIDARSQAPFLSVEELRSRGILGPKTYEKIAPLVTVGG
jgi:competence protein ComEA